ncbi:MAG: alpha/beta hydrolase [Bryobacteraceae bacterium]
MPPDGNTGEPEHRTFTARLDCHYLLHKPPAIDENTLLVAALHGYGSNPDAMLRLTSTWFPDDVIASVQGPSQFFASPNLPSGETGYSWSTRDHAELSIRLHHEMLLHVLHEAGERFGIPRKRRLLLGFSQPVGLNYRFAATHTDEVRGVIGVCGGVPKNWENGPYGKVSAALLHIARSGDEFYAPAVSEKFEAKLKLRAEDVEFHMLEGGHRFPSRGKPIVDRWRESRYIFG